MFTFFIVKILMKCFSVFQRVEYFHRLPVFFGILFLSHFFLLFLCQSVTVENEGKRFGFIVAFLMMCFTADDLKLREYIAKTAVDDVFDKAREAAVGIAADDDNLTGPMNQLAHILKTV